MPFAHKVDVCVAFDGSTQHKRTDHRNFQSQIRYMDCERAADIIYINIHGKNNTRGRWLTNIVYNSQKPEKQG